MGKARDVIARMVSTGAPASPSVGVISEVSQIDVGKERKETVYKVLYVDRSGNRVLAENVRPLRRSGLSLPSFKPDQFVMLGFVDGNTAIPYIIDRYTEDVYKLQEEQRDRASTFTLHAWKYVVAAMKRTRFGG